VVDKSAGGKNAELSLKYTEGKVLSSWVSGRINYILSMKELRYKKWICCKGGIEESWTEFLNGLASTKYT